MSTPAPFFQDDQMSYGSTQEPSPPPQSDEEVSNNNSPSRENDHPYYHRTTTTTTSPSTTEESQQHHHHKEQQDITQQQPEDVHIHHHHQHEHHHSSYEESSMVNPQDDDDDEGEMYEMSAAERMALSFGGGIATLSATPQEISHDDIIAQSSSSSIATTQEQSSPDVSAADASALHILSASATSPLVTEKQPEPNHLPAIFRAIKEVRDSPTTSSTSGTTATSTTPALTAKQHATYPSGPRHLSSSQSFVPTSTTTTNASQSHPSPMLNRPQRILSHPHHPHAPPHGPLSSPQQLQQQQQQQQSQFMRRPMMPHHKSPHAIPGGDMMTQGAYMMPRAHPVPSSSAPTPQRYPPSRMYAHSHPDAYPSPYAGRGVSARMPHPYHSSPTHPPSTHPYAAYYGQHGLRPIPAKGQHVNGNGYYPMYPSPSMSQMPPGYHPSYPGPQSPYGPASGSKMVHRPLTGAPQPQTSMKSPMHPSTDAATDQVKVKTEANIRPMDQRSNGTTNRAPPASVRQSPVAAVASGAPAVASDVDVKTSPSTVPSASPASVAITPAVLPSSSNGSSSASSAASTPITPKKPMMPHGQTAPAWAPSTPKALAPTNSPKVSLPNAPRGPTSSAVIRHGFPNRRAAPYMQSMVASPYGVHPSHMHPYAQHSMMYPEYPSHYYPMDGEGMEVDEDMEGFGEEAYYDPSYYYPPAQAHPSYVSSSSVSYEPPVFRRVDPVVSGTDPATVSSAQRFNSRSRRHQSDPHILPVSEGERALLSQTLSARAKASRDRRMVQTWPNLRTQVQIGAMNMKNFNLKEKDKIVIPLYRPNMNTTIDVTVTGPDLPKLRHTTLVLQILVDQPKSNMNVWKDVKSENQLFEDKIPVEGCEVRASGGRLTMSATDSKQKMEVKFQLVNISRKSRAGRMSRFGPVYRIVAHHEMDNGEHFVVDEKHCVFGIINTGKYQTYQHKYATLIERLTARPDLVKQILDDEDKDGVAKEELALLLNMMDSSSGDDDDDDDQVHSSDTHQESQSPKTITPPTSSPPLSQISKLSQLNAQPNAAPQQLI